MNPQKNPNSLPARLAGLAYSLVCYLVFLATFLYLIGFLGGSVCQKPSTMAPSSIGHWQH